MYPLGGTNPVFNRLVACPEGPIKQHYVNGQVAVGVCVCAFVLLLLYMLCNVCQELMKEGASNCVERHLNLNGCDTSLLWTYSQVGHKCCFHSQRITPHASRLRYTARRTQAYVRTCIYGAGAWRYTMDSKL